VADGAAVGGAVPHAPHLAGHADVAAPHSLSARQNGRSSTPKHSKHVWHVAGQSCFFWGNEQSALKQSATLSCTPRQNPMVGAVVGAAVGPTVGKVEGTAVGETVGNAVGEAVGALVGTAVGPAVGPAVGDAVGERVGEEVGKAEGLSVGCPDGLADGETVGLADGQTLHFPGHTRSTPFPRAQTTLARRQKTRSGVPWHPKQVPHVPGQASRNVSLLQSTAVEH